MKDHLFDCKAYLKDISNIQSWIVKNNIYSKSLLLKKRLHYQQTSQITLI